MVALASGALSALAAVCQAIDLIRPMPAAPPRWLNERRMPKYRRMGHTKRSSSGRFKGSKGAKRATRLGGNHARSRYGRAA